jgi:SAM-dependent methyltransferase
LDDIFGRALLDYHRGDRGNAFEWERSDGAHIVQPLGVYYEGFRPLETAAMDHADGRILDVGCGAGKHALEFGRRGLSCAGVDVSPLAIRVCQERGIVHLHNVDIFSNTLPDGGYDCITFFSNNLSIGGTVDGVKRLLAETARLTGPFGQLISINRDVTKFGSAQDQTYHRKNLAAAHPAGQIRMRAHYKGVGGSWFNWLFVSPEELANWSAAAGWSVREIIQGNQGEYCAVLGRMPFRGAAPAPSL